MAAGSVAERVRGLFRETLSVEPPAPTADLIDGGLLDSLALVELIFAIANYNGVVRFLASLEIDLEEEYYPLLEQYPLPPGSSLPAKRGEG